MPRAGLTTARVIEEAAALADEVGYDGLTLTGLATRLGVATPSLYKHVSSREALRVGVAVLALMEIGAAIDLAAAGAHSTTHGSTLVAIAGAYRRFASRYPGRYAATMRAAGPKHPELEAPSAAAMRATFAALAEFGLTGDAAIHAIRALRACLHGFVALESGGGFGLPQDVERSFTLMVGTLEAGLRAQGASSIEA